MSTPPHHGPLTPVSTAGQQPNQVPPPQPPPQGRVSDPENKENVPGGDGSDSTSANTETAEQEDGDGTADQNDDGGTAAADREGDDGTTHQADGDGTTAQDDVDGTTNQEDDDGTNDPEDDEYDEQSPLPVSPVNLPPEAPEVIYPVNPNLVNHNGAAVMPPNQAISVAVPPPAAPGNPGPLQELVEIPQVRYATVPEGQEAPEFLSPKVADNSATVPSCHVCNEPPQN